MIDKTYLLTIRDCPKSVNAGGGGARANRYAAHREKQRWEGLFLMELLAAKVPRAMQFVTIDLTVRWKRRNHRDVENYRHPITKPLLDALKKGSYVPDDTDEYVHVKGLTFEYPTEWEYIDPRVTSELIVLLEASYL
jgi:hypothetical protein